MTNSNSTQSAVASSSRKLTRTSSDGKWESFEKFAGLMRYVPNGMYYARAKVPGKNGKPVVTRASLETDVFTTAKDRLRLKMIELRTPKKPKAQTGTFADGCAKFDQATETRRDLADTSRVYRHRCVDCIVRSWPGIETRRADTITEAEMQKWAKDYADKYAAPFCNGSLNVFREILHLAGLKHDENPAYKIKRLGVPQTELELPTADQFSKVVETMRNSGAATSKANADLAMFLALSGARKKEAWGVLWRDADFDKNEIVISCAKRRTASQERRTRRVPMVPAMRAFLERLKAELNPKPEDAICRVKTCDEALTAACKKVGCTRLTHHDLRHLFATFCIEAGIDVPSVSKWLGHSDGGALAMKTYGHLRREHSQLMASRVKVNFGALPQPALVPQLPAPELATVTA
jgi:integrase